MYIDTHSVMGESVTCGVFQLRDCELSPVVNRDLCRRVRSVNGLTHHKPVVRNDIRLSARLIHSLDQRGVLWAGEVCYTFI